jgi:signal peptidase
MSVTLSQLTGIRLEISSINFLNSTLLPTFAENLLATLLALLAGPLAAIAYRAVLEAFWWFVPVLPDLSWVFKGLIGTLVPIFGMIFINSYYTIKSGRHRVRSTESHGFPVGWIATSIAAVVIVWFAVGLFPFQPALVGSGSMQPVMYTGDVVIIAKVPADMVEEGDIIQFREEGDITIVHRVIEIRETDNSYVFITKGDDNDKPDTDPVLPANVVGKAVYTVPRVGWISIWVKNFFMG